MPKARLHEGTRGGVERLCWRAQYVVDDRRNLRGFTLIIDGAPLQFEPCLLTRLTLSTHQGFITAGTLTLQKASLHWGKG
jgi:hypothetical protein